MNKTSIILIGALAFDLGLVVVASHALPAVQKLREASLPTEQISLTFQKFDAANTPQTCQAKGGKTANEHGVQGCVLPGSAQGLVISKPFDTSSPALTH